MRRDDLEGPDDRASLLVIAQVTPAEVVLEGNGSRYRLGYPDGFTNPAERPRGRPGRDDEIHGPRSRPV